MKLLKNIKRQSSVLFFRGQQCTYHQNQALNAVKKLKMPSLSPTMEDGTIVKWLKNEGDKFEVGDVLADIQTDKAVVQMETQENGYLAKIILPNGTPGVKLGKTIAIIADKQSEISQIPAELLKDDEAPKAAPAPSAPAPSAPKAATTIASSSTSSKSAAEYKIPIVPSVKPMLAEYNLNPFDVPATGKAGRLTKGDVLQYIRQKNLKPQPIVHHHEAPKPTPQAAPQPAATTTTTQKPQAPAAKPVIVPTAAYDDIPTTTMRRVIASRLLESKQTIPHSYMAMEIQMDALLKYKNLLQEKKGIKVSVNDLLIQCVAKSLKEVPACNATFDKSKGTYQVQQSIDVSVAVAIPGGLITPIVKNADQLTVDGISTVVKDLGKRAKEGKLKPEEFQGGTICISNLGMFGITQFEAVINPPQAIILSVGGSSKKVVIPKVQAGKLDWDDMISQPVSVQSAQVGTFMTITANFDARAVDSTDVAKFLNALKGHIEMEGLSA